MNALAILNNYTPDEVVEVQERTKDLIVAAVQAGSGLPTYRQIARDLDIPILVVTKMIEQQPDLYEIMQLARTALASEVEARVGELAMGELTDFGEDGKPIDAMTTTQLSAAKMLLEANSPQYAKKPSAVTIINPRVPVGHEGKDRALTALEELNLRMINY